MLNKTNIYIYAPDIHEGDAVGNHCIGLSQLCEQLGYCTFLFAQRYSTQCAGVHISDATEIFDLIKADDYLFVSYSIFDSFLDEVTSLECKKICYYHDVTPHELLNDFEPITAELCRKALLQLPKMEIFNRVIASSNFSRNRLQKYISNCCISVIPPVFRGFGLLKYDSHHNKRSDFFDLLYVGRVVPHKRIEDVIETFSLLCKYSGCRNRLFIVGSMPNYAYSKMLYNLARKLGVAERITFTGTLSDADLAERFNSADAYLSMSEHEGFCIPVLEAMYFSLPCIIRSGTAADDLLGAHRYQVSSANDAAKAIVNLMDKPQSCTLYKQRVEEIVAQTNEEVWDAIFSEL